MSSLGINRRAAEYARLQELCAREPDAFEILRTLGDPPSVYLIRITCVGMAAKGSKGPVLADEHDLRIRLPESYPFGKPVVIVETPVFNPHVFVTNNNVCIGGVWNPTQTLDQLVLKLRMLLRWDTVVIDPDSPANLAAMQWAEHHWADLPLDKPPAEPAAEPAFDPTVPSEQPPPRIQWAE